MPDNRYWRPPGRGYFLQVFSIRGSRKRPKEDEYGDHFFGGGFWDADFQVRDVPDQRIRTYEIPVIARNSAAEKSPSETRPCMRSPVSEKGDEIAKKGA
jgi:hypothetical protein